MNKKITINYKEAQEIMILLNVLQVIPSKAIQKKARKYYKLIMGKVFPSYHR